jgi:hypothetical protein
MNTYNVENALLNIHSYLKGNILAQNSDDK